MKTISFSWALNIKRRSTEGGINDRYPGRTTEKWFEQPIHQLRKAKFHIELNMASNNRSIKKSFYRYVNKRKTREGVGPVWKETEDLITWDKEKAEG